MCGRPLPIEYEKDCCPGCEEDVLFKEIRDYIRENDVTEFELAEIFHIPQSKVRHWIKEGRIEYVTEENANKLMNNRCQRCGTPVSFGTLCTNCMRLMNGGKEITYTSATKAPERNRMRFLNNDELK